MFSFLLFLLTALAQDQPTPKLDGVFFYETFQTPIEGRWVRSAKEKFAQGEWNVGRVDSASYIGDDRSLILERPAQHHAISTKFTHSIGGVEGKDFVVQYEVRFNEPHSCGGAYLKLLHASDVHPRDFDNETPYVIMFGPDKCGGNDKVHFIIRHKNPISHKWEEKHLINPPKIKTDKLVHLYTLVVRKDNTYEIFIDQKSEKKGSLFEDFAPAINPPKEIDDPSDSKPRDWVDVASIPDPTASKPDDWDEDQPKQIIDERAVKPSSWCDDCPANIPDPGLSKPEDWDDEMDGEWTAPLIENPVCAESGCGHWSPPLIANPKYKGKWSAPMIANPAYKGPWKARQIPNPDYFEDKAPHALAPIDGVGFELWTLHQNIEFDNIFIDHSEEKAFEFASQTWAQKFAADKSKQGADEGLLEQFGEWVSENLVLFLAVVIIFLVGLIFFLFWLFGGADTTEPREARETKRRDGKQARPSAQSSSSGAAPKPSSSAPPAAASASDSASEAEAPAQQSSEDAPEAEPDETPAAGAGPGKRRNTKKPPKAD